MTVMILISSVALLVGIVGSFVIWRFDAQRAEEISHTPADPRIVTLPLAASQPRPVLREGPRDRSS